MAEKFSQLPQADALTGDEIAAVSQDVDGTLTSVQTSLQDLKNMVLGTPLTVVNGGFEAATDLDGWTITKGSPTAGTPSNNGYANLGPYRGSKFLKHANSDSQDFEVEQEIALVGDRGGALVVTWFGAQTSSLEDFPYIECEFFDASAASLGPAVRESEGAGPDLDTWYRHQHTFTAPDGAVSVKLRAGGAYAAGSITNAGIDEISAVFIPNASGGDVEEAPEDGEIYGRRDAAWAPLGSAATADAAAFPFTNLIGYGGRQADMSANAYGMFTQQIGSSPFDFTSSWMFYNGATVSEAGKFIHNNDDFGGNLGSMTQTTIDLINAMGRTGTYARYGIEFYIAELSCGGGTANELLSTGLYLALGNGSKFIFSASSFSTFTGWVRAVDGDAALFGNPHSEGDVREINGVPHLSPNYYILTPAEGWVFMRYVRVAPQGYDASFPRFYGERNVTKIQIACPAFFCGAVDPGIYTAPLLSAGSME